MNRNLEVDAWDVTVEALENGNAKVSHGSGEIVLLRAE
jgi:hypothetical protein